MEFFLWWVEISSKIELLYLVWKHLDIFQFNSRSIMSKIEVIKKCSHELISLPIQEIIFTNDQMILEIKMYFEGQIFSSF